MLTTRFKINLADYQRVISKAAAVHGVYEPVLDKMASFDRASMTTNEFGTWIMPPADAEKADDVKDNKIVTGEGYELSLCELENSDEVSRVVLERAVDCCRSGRVAFIAVGGGTGTAFVEGTAWYEVNFRLDGDTMTYMFCDCPYPGLCKHLLAVALTIRTLVKKGNIAPERDFTAIDNGRFWSMAAHSGKKVIL